MTLVLDVSNYDESTFDAECMKADHVDAIILGCQREDVADRMAAKAQAAGLPIMATYAFLYFGQDTLGQTMAAVRISKKYGISRVFLDCESGQGTERDGITVEERQADLRDCIHAVTTEGLSAGIYTGAYWWPAKMGNTTEWSALPLWHAAYYNDHTKQKAVSYGGWSECAIHQWTSTLNVCGRNRDANEVWDLSLMEEDMTEDEVAAIVDGRLDATLGLTLLALMEQMLGIQPSTFDTTNQKRVDAITAKLTPAIVAVQEITLSKGTTFTGVIQ